MYLRGLLMYFMNSLIQIECFLIQSGGISNLVTGWYRTFRFITVFISNSLSNDPIQMGVQALQASEKMLKFDQLQGHFQGI